MSNLKLDTTALIKDDSPMGSPSSERIEDTLSRSAVDTQNIGEITVDQLLDLDKQTFEDLLEKKKVTESKITRGFAEKGIPPGLYKVDGQTYFVCPRAFFYEDDVIGQMIVDIAKLTGAVIKELPASVKKSNTYDERFITGLWFGLFSSTNQKRSRTKESYELGRTCTFSLIVKNVFESTPQLGSRALQKDHFFFGNNSEEVFNKAKVPFYVKMKLQSFYEDPRLGYLVYGILNYAAAFVGVSNLTEAESDKVIAAHLLPVDQLITSCYPTVLVKQGRKEEKRVRKPNPIRTSPLYTREEMELISSITNPIFTDLASLSEEYESVVFSQGFAAVEQQIRGIIRVRWETLQRFANRTKLRLQAIRKIVNNPTLKKANVLQEHVSLLLNSYQLPVSELIADIKHITGATSLKDLASVTYKKEFNSTGEVLGFLSTRIYDIYKKIEPKLPHIETYKKPESFHEPRDVDYEKAISLLIRTRNRLGNLQFTARDFESVKSFKLFGRINNLKINVNRLLEEIQSLSAIETIATDTAIRLISEGKYVSTQEFIKETLDTVLKIKIRLLKVTESRPKFESSEEVRNLLTKFNESLSALGLNQGAYRPLE
jgi:hypothetical protein